MESGAPDPPVSHGPGPADRGLMRRGGAILATVLLGLSAIASLAIMSDAELVPDGVLQTAPCFRARVGTVHDGTTTLAAAGATTVAIPAVAPEQSVVVHSAATASGDPADAMVAVELVDATTLRLTRSGGVGSVTVAWHVVEYDCGIRVRRGTSTGSTAASRDIALPVTDPARAFTTVSVAAGAGAATSSPATQVTATLADPTTLRLQAGGTPAADARWSWQVVEVVRDADVDAEHVTATLGAGDLSTTVALAAPVDPSRTLLLAGVRSSAGDLEQVAVTAELTAADEVTLERTASGAAVTVELQVVELLDGTIVQRGELTVGAAATTATSSLASPVDETRTTPLATGTAWGGAAAAGRTDAGAEAIGRALGRFDLDDPSTVRVTRGRTDATTTWTYQAVTWGGPRWWDLDWGYRERIEVTTAATASPDGYSIPVTFDHAAMVAAGQSRADGDDIRVLRWDGTGWVELDRVLEDGSAWDGTDTTFWFRTETPIDPTTTDVSYWLHHGNPGAAAPPADPAAVFLATEGFESGLGGFSERTTGTGWYVADDWSHRRSVTIPAGSVATTLTDLPVLVSVTDPTMGAQAQADGSDLRFTASDGTPLAHELEAWDAGTGRLLAWVEVPAVSPGAATSLWLYWGATDAPDQQDVRGTWSGGYEGVWHLAEDPTGDLPHADDSSPAGRDGVRLGAASVVGTAGVVGAGTAFAADSGRLAVGTTVTRDEPLTISAWATGDTGGGGTVVRLEDGGAVHATLELVPDGGGGLAVSGSLRDATGALHTVTGGSLAVGTPGHVALTWDGTRLRAWLDGTIVDDTFVTSRQVATGVEIALGAGPDAGAAPLDGTLDEVRVERVARSGPWLAAQVAMQSAPGTFATVGAATGGSWFAAGTWAARTPLVVDAGVVDTSGDGEDLVDFPLLVQITDADLVGATRADGADLVFTGDDGSVRLDHEIESWDPGTGALTAWVRVPLLSASVDTQLFLYHDNPGATDQQDPAGTFRAGFTSVHHLADDPEEVAP